MPNQTLIAVPLNVAEPDNLLRFLRSLIEKLDIVLGYRGDDAYVSQTDLSSSNQTISQILTSISDAVDQLTGFLNELADEVTVLTETVGTNTSDIETLKECVDLGNAYHDFDANEYENLQCRGYFETLGSNISNAPYTPVGAEIYYNFLNSATTASGGVVHELLAYSTTTLVPTKYFRIGNTWTNAKALGWN